MIIPLCKTLFLNRYESLCNFNGLPFYDFIYSNAITTEQFVSYLKSFLEYLRGAQINIAKLPEKSYTYWILQKNGLCRDLTFNNYVNIYLGNNYEDYFSGLSKSTRQNIRTAYNRLKSDSLRMRFEIVYRKRIPRKLLKETLEIYCNRHFCRYHEKTSKLKYFYLQYLDFTTVCLKKHKNRFWAFLSINEKPVAFFAGFYDEISDCIDARRISMDDNYSRYSPGAVLINETARALIDNYHVKNLDLTCGDENYKLSMGGEIYHAVKFRLDNSTLEG